MSYNPTLLYANLNKMNLSKEEMDFIKENKYEDWPELFNYAFELMEKIEALEEINTNLQRVKELENETRIEQGRLLVEIFKMKTVEKYNLTKNTLSDME